MITKWLLINILTVLFIIVWSAFQGFDSNTILIGKILAQVAFILFLVNLNMYFIFLLIRKSKVRNVKIKLARISKQMMRYHIPSAITATGLILFHSTIMLFVHDWSLKTASGVSAIGALFILLFSGLLRRQKATGMRRRLHYRTAFLFFTFVLVHIFI